MPDELTTFVNMVRKMREVQRVYFRTRDYNAMLESKKYESLVDKYIKDFDEQQAPDLFQGEELPF